MCELLHIPKSVLVYWGQVLLNLDWVLLAVQWLCVRMRGRVCVLWCIHWVLVFVLLVLSAKVEQVKFDTTQLHARPELAAEQRMVDDASGEIEVRELLWLAQGGIFSLFPALLGLFSLGDTKDGPHGSFPHKGQALISPL